jgi:hypothetical protein
MHIEFIIVMNNIHYGSMEAIIVWCMAPSRVCVYVCVCVCVCVLKLNNKTLLFLHYQYCVNFENILLDSSLLV